jgi:hypothetical protein
MLKHAMETESSGPVRLFVGTTAQTGSDFVWELGRTWDQTKK